MEKINNKEAIFLTISCTLGITVLVSSQIIASSCLSSSLINTGYISFVALAITILICLLYKKFIGLSFLDITEYLGGKFLKFTVGIAFFSYFLYTAAVVLCKAVNCLQIVYYPMTNVSYTILLFVIAACFACNLKNNAFLRATFLFVPPVIIAIFFIFVGNLKNFNYENIYPLLGNGINATFGYGISNLYTFGGLAYILFLPQHLKRPDKFMSISVISTIISSVTLTLTVGTIILMFNKNITSGQLFPLYLSVRYIEFGTFFQRLDSAFLLVMNIAICSFLGIYSNLCLDIFQNITNITDKKPVSYCFVLLLFALTLWIDSNFSLEVLQEAVFKIYFFSVLILGLVILTLSNIKKILSNRKELT